MVKAWVCKTLIPGSNPGAASNFFETFQFAGMAELVDAKDLKSFEL